MTNIGRAAEILEARHGEDQMEGDGVVGCFDATAAAQALADAGLLTPDPQIIRTLDEIEALDPQTLLMESSASGLTPLSSAWQWIDSRTGEVWYGAKKCLPAVVVATGAQVRAARAALQEATE